VADRVADGVQALAARLTTLGPATRLVVCGARAIAALSLAAASRRDLDLADQVVLVGSHPAERQLFGLALALAATRTAPKVVAPSELAAQAIDSAAALAKRWKLTRIDVALIGRDADPVARDAARAFAVELGAAEVIEEDFLQGAGESAAGAGT